MTLFPRVPFDTAAYRTLTQRACFVCELLAGNPAYAHHVVYRDEASIALLNRMPSLWGHLLVAPTTHREHAVGDFPEKEYLALQRTIHRCGRALTSVVPTERLYVLSLGSQQGNRHVHWHLAPLPPGVPYDEQQLEALAVRRGYLDVPDEAMSGLAARIAAAM